MTTFASDDIYDAIVVGIGGHGSAALAHLAQALPGGRVLGIERFDLTHAFGSSHGKSRIYRQAYFEHPACKHPSLARPDPPDGLLDVPLLQRSLILWKELKAFYEFTTQDLEQPLLTLCGGLMVGRADDTVIQGTLSSIAQYSLPHELLTPEQVSERFPMFHPSDEEVGIFEPTAGTLNPEKCILAHVMLAKHHGAHVHSLEIMSTYDTLANGLIEVVTDKATYHTRKLVLTLGAWAVDAFQQILPFPLHLERRVLYWFKPLQPALDWTNMPVYIWDLGEGRNFYGFPMDETCPGAVKIAQHNLPNHPTLPTPESIERVVNEEEIAEMRAIFQQKMPALNGELIDTATCMYTSTPDEHFLIDLHPDNPNIILASPCSGHGYKFCSVVGEIIKDLVVTGDSEKNDISLFRIAARG